MTAHRQFAFQNVNTDETHLTPERPNFVFKGRQRQVQDFLPTERQCGLPDHKTINASGQVHKTYVQHEALTAVQKTIEKSHTALETRNAWNQTDHGLLISPAREDAEGQDDRSCIERDPVEHALLPGSRTSP
jgi:hypothetical protein